MIDELGCGVVQVNPTVPVGEDDTGLSVTEPGVAVAGSFPLVGLRAGGSVPNVMVTAGVGAPVPVTALQLSN
jgi:hypothetical protein